MSALIQFQPVSLVKRERLQAAAIGKFVLIMFAFMAIIGNMFAASVAALILFVFYFAETISWRRYYITDIHVSASEIQIKYLDRNEPKYLSLPPGSVSCRVRFIWYKVRSPVQFLELRYGKKRIRQFAIGDWNVNIFELVINGLHSPENQ